MLIGYARVSTDEQNADLQHDALRAAGCEKIFTDFASGAAVDRPQLAIALADLSPADVLVVWKLDRLGRKVLHVLTIIADLAARQVGFRSLTQPIDTTTPIGRATASILAVFAELERDMIHERINAGIVAAKARGIHCGRPSRADPAQVRAALAEQAAGRLTMRGAASKVGLSERRLYELKAQGVGCPPPPGVA